MAAINLERSIERILEEQTRDGLFPTYRSENTNDFSKPINQEKSESLDNPGLHYFITEKLLRNHKNNPKIAISFKHGLKVVFDNAINYNGDYFWRWLKNPNRPDYIYPPDHDDTARAMATIETAKELMPDLIKYFEENGKYPSHLINQDYTTLLLKDLFWVDENFKPIFDDSRKEKGVFTFVRKLGFKGDNEIDPVVNLNILYSYLLYLGNKQKEKDSIVEGIGTYLSKFVLSNKFDNTFEELSRFYLSHALFANIFSDVVGLDSNVFSENVKGRVVEKMRVYKSRNVLETAFSTGALLKLGYKGEEINKGINEIVESSDNGIWPACPFYQHKRLNHLFGSKAATSVFCLETLTNYEIRKQGV